MSMQSGCLAPRILTTSNWRSSRLKPWNIFHYVFYSSKAQFWKWTCWPLPLSWRSSPWGSQCAFQILSWKESGSIITFKDVIQWQSFYRPTTRAIASINLPSPCWRHLFHCRSSIWGFPFQAMSDAKVNSKGLRRTQLCDCSGNVGCCITFFKDTNRRKRIWSELHLIFSSSLRDLSRRAFTFSRWWW